MAPGADEWTSFGPQDKADALRRLSDSIPNPSFAVQSVTSYRLLYSLYKPADHGLVVIGSVHSSAPGAESGSEQIGGRFLTFWDQVWPAEDAYNEDCSKWGLSWLMWQTRDENGLPAKRVPFTANVSADSSVSPDLGMAAKPSEQPAAEPADVTPDVLRMDDDFGHLDDVKSAQSSNEEARNGDKHETPNEPSQVKATLGQVEEPQQSDVTFYVQTAWSAFVSALAADDVASASSILFGPDAVTLMAPGADSITLATELEKANLLNELKASHLSLSVMVEEVAVLQGSESTQNSESSTISALVRSTYSIANAQGVDAEHGKRVELWRASATNEREWHLSWNRIPSVLKMDYHFGHQDEVKTARDNEEYLKGKAGRDEEPQQRDVRFYVQKVWSAFVSALAADDVASASSNLFGPDAVTLMAPGADSITLATELQKTNLLKELKWSQLSLTVSVGEIAVLQDADTKLISGSRSYAALVRSNYTIVDDQGFRVEHGRRVELWRPSSTNPREWHLSWSMWNDDGAVFRRTSGTATS
ncbi:unnamed protein product [Closterium sp. NIES-53]